MKSQLTAVRPFLTTFATPRTGSDDSVGRYCETRHVWIVDSATGAQPLILLRPDIGQTATSTKVEVEGDDTDVATGLDYGTHTYVKTEDDDLDRAAATVELGSSTRVLGEVDDLERTAASILSVTTKTDAQLERDDTAVGLEMFEPEVEAHIAPIRIQ